MATVEVPHLQWPLRMSGRSLAVNEQDELPDVRQCVRVLLVTPLGARLLAPDVGVPDPTFTGGVDPDDLAERLMDEETGEPRALVTVTTDGVDEHGEQVVRVRVALADEGHDVALDEEVAGG